MSLVLLWKLTPKEEFFFGRYAIISPGLLESLGTRPGIWRDETHPSDFV